MNLPLAVANTPTTVYNTNKYSSSITIRVSEFARLRNTHSQDIGSFGLEKIDSTLSGAGKRRTPPRTRHRASRKGKGRGTLQHQTRTILSDQ
jgi:hypothetical protein